MLRSLISVWCKRVADCASSTAKLYLQSLAILSSIGPCSGATPTPFGKTLNVSPVLCGSYCAPPQFRLTPCWHNSAREGGTSTKPWASTLWDAARAENKTNEDAHPVNTLPLLKLFFI